jgi:hypothetical protein
MDGCPAACLPSERAKAHMKKTILALVVGFAVMIPSVALAAGSSAQDAYTHKTPTSSATTTAPAPTTAAATTGTPTVAAGTTAATTASGTLPFTGLDLAALLVGASVLLGGGLAVRYLSRDQHN